MNKDMDHKHAQSIGVFDSGVGGLTVVQKLFQVLPGEHIVYFGDTARVPYGGNSPDTIVRYSLENTCFLMEHDIKLLVVACNTSSSCAIDHLRRFANIPVVEVIEPSVEGAVQATRNKRIGVIGTKATIGSGVHQKQILALLPEAKVFPAACPLLVPLVEERFASHQASRLIVREYLKPLLAENIDTLILGCTHYPLLRDIIEEEAGPDVAIVDPALTCAEKVSHSLKAKNLQRQANQAPKHRYFVSDDPEKFRLIGREFLGMPLEHVICVKK